MALCLVKFQLIHIDDLTDTSFPILKHSLWLCCSLIQIFFSCCLISLLLRVCSEKAQWNPPFPISLTERTWLMMMSLLVFSSVLILLSVQCSCLIWQKPGLSGIHSFTSLLLFTFVLIPGLIHSSERSSDSATRGLALTKHVSLNRIVKSVTIPIVRNGYSILCLMLFLLQFSYICSLLWSIFDTFIWLMMWPVEVTVVFCIMMISDIHSALQWLHSTNSFVKMPIEKMMKATFIVGGIQYLKWLSILRNWLNLWYWNRQKKCNRNDMKVSYDSSKLDYIFSEVYSVNKSANVVMAMKKIFNVNCIIIINEMKKYPLSASMARSCLWLYYKYLNGAVEMCIYANAMSVNVIYCG